MKKIKIVTFLFFLLVAKNLFATGQIGDKLIVDENTRWIPPNLLEEYFSKKGERTIDGMGFRAPHTGLWRGYIATWKLENDSLFLIRVQADSITEINFIKEFGASKVFAEWVTNTIICPQGEILQFKHTNYMSICEDEVNYTFEKGKLIETENIVYLERNNALLFPSEEFLQDTIRAVILKSLDKFERDSLDANYNCNLYVYFGENREISHIRFREAPKNIDEEIILRNAKEALKGFPKLMKVNHKWYSLPIISIDFRGSDFKSSYDRK